MIKNIYTYHPQTREFLSESQADKSPLEKEVYLLPAFSTEIPPHSVQANQIQVFDPIEKKWSLLPDFRNTKLYSKIDGSPVVITEIGKTPDDYNATSKNRPGPTYLFVGDDWIIDPLLITQELEKKKLKKIEEIKKKRDEVRFNGGIKIGQFWFQSDERSQTDFMALKEVATGKSLSDVLVSKWRTLNGVTVDITVDLVNKIFTSLISRAIQIDQIAEGHKAKIKTSIAPENYDISTGWPITYQEDIVIKPVTKGV